MAGVHDADGREQASVNGTPPDRAKDDEQHLGDGTTPAVVDVIADARERTSDTFEAPARGPTWS